jgi:NAD(P)-dependent dehydrogenase (short-subunit alcohol dehydrogenase family)
MAGILTDRVAVVTGSGRGLGKAYALAMAQQGAKVIVNDLGCEADGAGFSQMLADEVTEEIKKAGGTAIANYDSVTNSEGADRIIKTAVDKFGRLDILINNAGILRGNFIFDMSDEDFDLTVKTHLYGTFYCLRAASRIMKEQHYGRILNVSSVIGFGISAGEANYAAAKEGIIALTYTAARDLVRFGITCNAIRPCGDSRMSQVSGATRERLGKILGESVKIGPGIFESGTPEDICPLVIYLVSEQAKNVSCCVFDVHRSYVAIYDNPTQKSQTLTKKEGSFTHEELAKLLPLTLTKDIQLPSPVILQKDGVTKYMAGAKGWLWANEHLNEVPPQ